MKVLVVYSGGLDSTVLLYEMLRRGHEVIALSVNYGQKHRVELSHAKEITSALGVHHEVADLSAITRLLGGSSQTESGIAVPEGHYAADNMRVTVVPNRNMIMLAVAAGAAIAQGCAGVAIGVHAGDHFVYPDCRPVFHSAMADALALCHEPGLELMRPFVYISKSDIVRLGAELGVPFEKTWSCYKGGAKHCGRCGTCVERLESFKIAGVEDPTEYEDAESWKLVCA